MNSDQMNELARRKIELEHEMIFPHLCMKGVTSETLKEFINTLDEEVTKLNRYKGEMLRRCQDESAMAKLRDFIDVDMIYDENYPHTGESLIQRFNEYLVKTEKKAIDKLKHERATLRESFWYDDYCLFKGLRSLHGYLCSDILNEYEDTLYELFGAVLVDDLEIELYTELKCGKTIWDYLDKDEKLKTSYKRKLRRRQLMNSRMRNFRRDLMS